MCHERMTLRCIPWWLTVCKSIATCEFGWLQVILARLEIGSRRHESRHAKVDDKSCLSFYCCVIFPRKCRSLFTWRKKCHRCFTGADSPVARDGWVLRVIVTSTASDLLSLNSLSSTFLCCIIFLFSDYLFVLSLFLAVLLN